MSGSLILAALPAVFIPSFTAASTDMINPDTRPADAIGPIGRTVHAF